MWLIDYAVFVCTSPMKWFLLQKKYVLIGMPQHQHGSISSIKHFNSNSKQKRTIISTDFNTQKFLMEIKMNECVNKLDAVVHHHHTAHAHLTVAYTLKGIEKFFFLCYFFLFWMPNKIYWVFGVRVMVQLMNR